MAVFHKQQKQKHDYDDRQTIRQNINRSHRTKRRCALHVEDVRPYNEDDWKVAYGIVIAPVEVHSVKEIL